MTKINIITRCSRLQNLSKVKDSIFTTDKFDIDWWVMFDSTSLKDVDAELLSEIQERGGRTHFLKNEPGDLGHQMINYALDRIKEGLVFILDDDNIIHEDFYETIHQEISLNPDKKGFVFNQRIDGKDFTGQEIRFCSPENMKVSHVDSAQVLFDISVIGKTRLIFGTYIADSIWIEQVYKNNDPDIFHFIDKILCYYNYLQGAKGALVPKILYIGDGMPEMKSNKRAYWESDDLKVVYRTDDSKLINDIKNFDPDFIISLGDYNSRQNLIHTHNDIRRRWANLYTTSQIGEVAYNSSMNYILEQYNKDLVSFFTPIYNTGDKLLRLYQSIAAQTHTNWEWVLVNDSSDGGKTLKMAEDLSKKDPRVKVYDFREKSKGVIGESKYRAAMLCRGYILAEIDHDDYILPDSAKVLLEAFDKFPDAGFAYTDCVEITEDWRTLTYGEGFCFGYGKYRKEMHMGIMMDVNESPNINPKTIRHIVGIPNHIRCWKRETYLKLGGHNRRLSIADDYELVVRTFLETKFVRIVKNCYLQFIYNNHTGANTHELSRADIQRRVRSIADFYNHKISKRFEELGIYDWAFHENQSNPLMVQSRFGTGEGIANYTYYPE